MTETFTARNGIAVEHHSEDDGDWLMVTYGRDRELGEEALNPAQVEAVREFFRAEEDKRLGRWRWPDDGDVVVYPREGLVAVVHQREIYSVTFARDSDEPEGGPQSVGWRAARAYFDAHPEPKPWHDAKPGEVYELRSVEGDRHALGWVAHDGTWDIITPRGKGITGAEDPVRELVAAGFEQFGGDVIAFKRVREGDG